MCKCGKLRQSHCLKEYAIKADFVCWKCSCSIFFESPPPHLDIFLTKFWSRVVTHVIKSENWEDEGKIWIVCYAPLLSPQKENCKISSLSNFPIFANILNLFHFMFESFLSRLVFRLRRNFLELGQEWEPGTRGWRDYWRNYC